MSKVEAVRCDLGGELRSHDDAHEVTVNGETLDICAEHAASHTVAQLLEHVAALQPPTEAEAAAEPYTEVL